jgi:hypothetical protein
MQLMRGGGLVGMGSRLARCVRWRCDVSYAVTIFPSVDTFTDRRYYAPLETNGGVGDSSKECGSATIAVRKTARAEAAEETAEAMTV